LEENLKLSRVKHEREELGQRISYTRREVEVLGRQLQRAAYQTIAVSKYLQIMGSEIRHNLPVVWNSALYMLGQFSEFIQPEISNHSPDILPVLLDYLDHALSSITLGGKDPSTVSRIFYALETFCESLEMNLVPHLLLIMSRATQAMADSYSFRIQELAISLVGTPAMPPRVPKSPTWGWWCPGWSSTLPYSTQMIRRCC
jgi:hypothetical protein